MLDTARTIAGTVFAAALAVTIAAGAAGAVEPEKKEITIGYGSMSGGFGGWWIAKDKGFFEEQGFDHVELLYTRTTTGLQMLNGGQIDALGTGCAEFFEATEAGFPNKVVGNLFDYNLYLIASRPAIKKPADLVGQTLAVNRLGDTGHLSARYALRRAGVDPDSVSYVQIGSTPERFSALDSGAVAAAVQAGALRPMVDAAHLNVLIDLQDPDVPNCLGGIAVSEEFAQKYPKTVEAMLRAMVKGNAYLSAGPAAETRQIFGDYMKLPADDDRVISSWEYFSGPAHSRKPMMTEKSARNVLAMMAEGDPKWADKDPAPYLDLSFMQKLDQEGYLDKVYDDIKAAR